VPQSDDSAYLKVNIAFNKRGRLIEPINVQLFFERVIPWVAPPKVREEDDIVIVTGELVTDNLGMIFESVGNKD
jgi:hypothetical protein